MPIVSYTVSTDRESSCHMSAVSLPSDLELLKLHVCSHAWTKSSYLSGRKIWLDSSDSVYITSVRQSICSERRPPRAERAHESHGDVHHLSNSKGWVTCRARYLSDRTPRSAYNQTEIAFVFLLDLYFSQTWATTVLSIKRTWSVN